MNSNSPPSGPLWISIVLFGLSALAACEDTRLNPLIQKADDEWIKGRNHTAIEFLKSSLEEQPTGPAAEEALFRLGEINYFSFNNNVQALIYFKELHQLNPKSKFSYAAQKYIAEIVEFVLKDYDQAIIEYQKLIDKFSDRGENGEHQYRIASIFFKKQDYAQALIEWEILLENYPDSSWVEKTAYKITNILYTLNRCQESRKRYGWFMKRFPESRFVSEMDFVMASCTEEEGDYEKAYQNFKALEGTYPYPTLLKMKLEGIENRIKKTANKEKKSPF